MREQDRILVVDDEAPIRRFLLQVLSGRETVAAANGAEAIEQVEASKFTLAVLDLNMPDIHGLALLRRLRKIDPELAVIILTAAPSEETAIEAANEGVDAYLVKPCDPTTILDRIDKAIERRKLRTEMREELLRVQLHADTYLDIAEDIVVNVAADGTVRMINRTGAETLGYEIDEIVGKNWFDHFVPKSIRATVKDVSRKILTGELDPVKHYRNAVLTSSGEERLIAWHNAEVRDEAGRITGHLSSGRDVTDDEIQRQRLKASEERYRTLLESMHDVVYRLDGDGNLSFVGPQISRYGYSAEEVIGGSPDNFVHEDDIEKLTAKLQQTYVDGGNMAPFEFRLRASDGRIFWMEETGRPLRDESGNVIGLVGVVRDITERRRAADALLRETERAQMLALQVERVSDIERQSLRRDLHDTVCQQLTGIGLHAEVLRATASRSTCPCVEQIGKISAMAMAGIEQAQQIAKGIEAVGGRRDGLLDALVDMADQAGTPDVKCRVTSRTVVEIDADAANQLYLIAREAVSNAVRHSGASRVLISLARRGRTVRLSVTDDGRGMPRKPRENGMGLTSMRERAELIGAKLAIRKGDKAGTVVEAVLREQKRGADAE